MKYYLGLIVAVVVGMFVVDKTMAMQKLTDLKNKVMPSGNTTT